VREACQAAESPYAIAAVPLLAEAGGRATYPWLDRIVVVDAAETVRHARLRQRDSIDAALATRMIQAQASRAQRLALADDVIVNDGHPEHLQPQVEALDRLYRHLAAGNPPP
jgi:dephospho-CoA kinase